jgi:predicted DNA-binding protein
LDADVEARLNGEYLWGRHFAYKNGKLVFASRFCFAPKRFGDVQIIPPGIDKPSFAQYNKKNCDTGRLGIMPLSLRIPPDKEKIINRAAAKAGKTKSAFILEAVDEKLGLVKDRAQTIKELAGWLPAEEAEKLRESLRVFSRIHEGDWD